MPLPLVDLSSYANPGGHTDAERRAVARQWDEAMCTVGFAMVVGHGVEPEVVAGLRRAANRFFGQPAEAKRAFSHGPYGNPDGGFTAVGGEAVNASRDGLGVDAGGEGEAVAVDPVESFVFEPHSAKRPPAELERPLAAYRTALLGTLDCLHRVTEEALGLEAHFFDPFFSPEPAADLRLAYYPPIGGSHTRLRMRPPPLSHCATPRRRSPAAAVGYGSHTDFAGYTILCQDEADEGRLDAGGLEVLLPSGEWVAVPPVRGGFVVNIGDLYQVWTNDRWKSTVHRVAAPPPGSTAAAAPRLSIPFFTGPTKSAIISAIPSCVPPGERPRHPPIEAGEHLRRKLAAIAQ